MSQASESAQSGPYAPAYPMTAAPASSLSDEALARVRAQYLRASALHHDCLSYLKRLSRQMRRYGASDTSPDGLHLWRQYELALHQLARVGRVYDACWQRYWAAAGLSPTTRKD